MRAVCTEPGRPDPAAVALAAPRPAEGDAVDPVVLDPVDAVEITVLTEPTRSFVPGSVGSRYTFAA